MRGGREGGRYPLLGHWGWGVVRGAGGGAWAQSFEGAGKGEEGLKCRGAVFSRELPDPPWTEERTCRQMCKGSDNLIVFALGLTCGRGTAEKWGRGQRSVPVLTGQPLRCVAAPCPAPGPGSLLLGGVRWLSIQEKSGLA